MSIPANPCQLAFLVLSLFAFRGAVFCRSAYLSVSKHCRKTSRVYILSHQFQQSPPRDKPSPWHITLLFFADIFLCYFLLRFGKAHVLQFHFNSLNNLCEVLCANNN